MNPWIIVIGLGEDGLENISSSTKAIIEGAEILVGGARHLGKIPDFGANRITWGNKLLEKVSNLKHYKGKKTCNIGVWRPHGVWRRCNFC
jgi:Precorrin-6B methylase 1